MTNPLSIPHSLTGFQRAAKQLVRDCRANNAAALARFAAVWRDAQVPSLQRCQHVIAREAGYGKWEQLSGAFPNEKKEPFIDWLMRRGCYLTAEQIMRLPIPAADGAFSSSDAYAWWLIAEAEANARNRPRYIDAGLQCLSWTFMDHMRALPFGSVGLGKSAMAGAFIEKAFARLPGMPTVSLGTHDPAIAAEEERDTHHDSLPYGVPCGFGRWIGGSCSPDVIRLMGIYRFGDHFWAHALAAELQTASEQQGAQNELPEAGAALTRYASATMRPVSGHTDFIEQLTRWCAPSARHPIVLGWMLGDSRSQRARSLAVTGRMASGKTVWVHKLIRQMAASTAIIVIDAIGDVRGPREALSSWAERTEHPRGLCVFDGQQQNGAFITLPPYPEHADAPRLLIVHGMDQAWIPTLTSWLHLQRTTTFLVIVSQEIPPPLRALATDLLEFSPLPTSRAPGVGRLTTNDGHVYYIDPSDAIPVPAPWESSS